jgi:hypothetical protein
VGEVRARWLELALDKANDKIEEIRAVRAHVFGEVSVVE